MINKPEKLLGSPSWGFSGDGEPKIDLEIVGCRNKEEQGASLVEYALLVALIAVIAIVAIRFLGQTVSTRFSSTASSINSN